MSDENTAVVGAAYNRLPSTMHDLYKYMEVVMDPRSKYDFGIYRIPRASHSKGKKPSLKTAMRIYRQHVLLAIGRALVARFRGVEFTALDVRTSIIMDFREKAIFKEYREVLLEHEDDIPTLEWLKNSLNLVEFIIDGTIQSDAKYMAPYNGTRWELTPFIKYAYNTFGMSFGKKKRVPKRS